MYTRDEKIAVMTMFYRSGLSKSAASRLPGYPSRHVLAAWEREAEAGLLPVERPVPPPRRRHAHASDAVKREALALLDKGLRPVDVAARLSLEPATVSGWRSRAREGTLFAKPTARRERAVASKGAYDPPRSGPLAGLSPDQIENLLLRAVLADLKAGGWDPGSISNRSKCELGERLRRETGLPLRSITGFLRISKSSYEYQRARLATRGDRDADIRPLVRELFAAERGARGYRAVHARMRRAGVVASEKRVLRVMREEGLRPAYAGRRRRRWSSYAGEVSKAPENLVGRDFHAPEPDALWLTDITEFRLPCGSKAYLSAVVDCFDGRPAAWSVGRHPDKGLANSSLEKALSQRRPGAATVVHSDRGGHYRWPEWIRLCEENGLVRSMSAKGCSPDNAACEGFFGRLKNEFFHHRGWSGVGVGEFMSRLDAYLEYYCEGRIKESLGWMSPNEYRRSLGYAV